MKFAVQMTVGVAVLSTVFAGSSALLVNAWHAGLALGVMEVPGLLGPWTLLGLTCAAGSFVVCVKLKDGIQGCGAPVPAFLIVVSAGIGLGALMLYVFPEDVPKHLAQLSCIGWLGALLGGVFGLADWDMSQGGS